MMFSSYDDDRTAHLGFKDRLIVLFKSFQQTVVIHINTYTFGVARIIKSQEHT